MHYVVAGPAGLNASVGLEALKRMAAAIANTDDDDSPSTISHRHQELDRIRGAFSDVDTALETVRGERRLAKMLAEVGTIRAANLQYLSDGPIDDLVITNRGGGESDHHAELISRSSAFLASANARRQRERRRTAGLVAVVGGVLLLVGVATVLACRKEGTVFINWSKCREQ